MSDAPDIGEIERIIDLAEQAGFSHCRIGINHIRGLIDRVRELEEANERLSVRLHAMRQARQVDEFDPEDHVEELREAREGIKQDINGFLEELEAARE